MKKNRIAVAGAGLIGVRHAALLKACPETELAAIVDPREATRIIAAEAGVNWFGSLDELFASDPPDGIIVATPNVNHLENGLTCVQAGCPMLIEKPLAVTSIEARTLVDAAQAGGIPILVGHHRRHNPLIRAAKSTIDEGALGRIRGVQAICWFYKPDPYYAEAPWRTRKGAGPIAVNLVHDIDLLRFLCGEVVRVQAQAAPSLRGFENEDVAAAVLGFENGAVGTITVSDMITAPWSWEMTARENPAYPPTDQSCYLIGGTRASLSLPDLTLWHNGESPDWMRPMNATTLLREQSEPLFNQIAHFAAVIDGREKPLVSGREGLETIRVIEAIQQAAESGEAITLSH